MKIENVCVYGNNVFIPDACTYYIVVVLLTEPDPPVVNNIDLKIQYSQSDGLLSSIDVSFPPAVSFSVYQYYLCTSHLP